jgi:hypothetical protein
MKTGVAYFGVRNPDFVWSDMIQLSQSGYTHVLHTVSEEDFEHYQKTMPKIIDLSIKAGLKVYVSPWGVGKVFGGEPFSQIAAKNPQAAQVTNFDKSLVSACPNSAVFREYMVKWIAFVCSTEVETIFWDEPHLFFEKEHEEIWACICNTCKKKFYQQHHHMMPASLSGTVIKFRQQSMVNFLDFVTKEVAKYGKKNCVCLLPHHVNDGIDNWDSIASLPHVNEIATDPYWDKGEKATEISKNYHKYSEEILNLAKKYNKEAQIWVKNFQIEDHNEDSVTAATWAAYNEGVRNIFSWAFKGATYMDSLSSANPDRVWELQTQAFLECHEKCNSSKK